jgi:hypothetical protein
MNKKLQNKRVLADDHEQTKFPGASFFIPTNFNSNNMKSTHNSSSSFSSKQATAASNLATAASNLAIAAANAAGSKDID